MARSDGVGLATGVANREGGGVVTLDLQELQTRLLAVSTALEAGDGERALDLLAALLADLSSGR